MFPLKPMDWLHSKKNTYDTLVSSCFFDYHKFSSLKHPFIISLFYESEVQVQCYSTGSSSWGLTDQNQIIAMQSFYLETQVKIPFPRSFRLLIEFSYLELYEKSQFSCHFSSSSQKQHWILLVLQIPDFLFCYQPEKELCFEGWYVTPIHII